MSTAAGGPRDRDDARPAASDDLPAAAGDVTTGVSGGGGPAGRRVRPSAGVRLGLLAAWGLTVVAVRGPWWAVGFAVVTVAVAVAARLPRRALRALVPILITATVAGAYQAWARGWEVGLEVALDLVTVVLAAIVVTATTPVSALLDAAARAARPFARWVDPERVALALALTVRSLPALLDAARETRDAARARGLERDPRALVVPAAVRAVGRARATGEALAARGLGD